MILSWLGGKTKLAPQIISIMPEHDVYIEPFFGGGSVFWNKPNTQFSVINDIDDLLINLWIVLRDKPQEFINKLNMTLLSRTQFDLFLDGLDNKTITDNLMKAIAYYYIIKISFCSIGVNFTPRSETPLVFTNAEIEENIQKISKKLIGVLIENKDFSNIISRYSDKKNALIYCDPPYYQTTQYTIPFTFEQHILLRNLLSKSESKWIVSYNNSDTIKELYKNYNIYYPKKIFYSTNSNNLSNNKNVEEIMIQEIIITNYDIQKTLPLFAEKL